jgi:hypothetical protein
MAGLGRKVFTAGEVLAAADVNGFLADQVVMVFDNAAARSSAIPTPTEGMMTYTKDDNAVQVFDGSTFTAVDTTISSLAGSAVFFGSTAVTAAYTAVAGLDNATIVVGGTAAVTVTVPDILSIGNSLNIIRDTSGTVTIAAGTGVTDWAGAGTAGTAVTFKIDEQYNGAQVLKTAANAYRVIGKITV